MKILALFVCLFSAAVLADNNRWSISNVPIGAESLIKKKLPNIISKSGDAIAYIERHFATGNTRLYFVVADQRCGSGKDMADSYFVLINGHKELINGGCYGSSPYMRLWLNPASEYIATDEFLESKEVAIEEVMPSDNKHRISQVFSAIGFKAVFYQYNSSS